MKTARWVGFELWDRPTCTAPWQRRPANLISRSTLVHRPDPGIHQAFTYLDLRVHPRMAVAQEAPAEPKLVLVPVLPGRSGRDRMKRSVGQSQQVRTINQFRPRVERSESIGRSIRHPVGLVRASNQCCDLSALLKSRTVFSERPFAPRLSPISFSPSSRAPDPFPSPRCCQLLPTCSSACRVRGQGPGNSGRRACRLNL